jgi:hypothetical protein
MIQKESLYDLSSILVLSGWKKLEESACRAMLVVGSSLENWGSEPFKTILRHETTFFGVTMFITCTHTLDVDLHTETFPMARKSPQLDLVCKSYVSRKSTYLVDHHGTSGCHVSPHYSNLWG